MKDSIIVVSGGIDSVTMLYDYKDEIALAVTFDYGSNHAANEIPFAKHHCEKLGVPHIVIPLDFMQQYFQSSLLSGASDIPEGDYGDDNMKSTVVPFRNGIMLSIAGGLAESKGLKKVMIANHGGDHHIYPDCRPSFILAMSDAVKFGTYENVTVNAPYTGKDKTWIVQRGNALNVDYSKTWSCYKGGTEHCGKCSTCLERKQAFAHAGIPDPTVYPESFRV